MPQAKGSLGTFRCEICRQIFSIRPGPHEDARCPACGHAYYEWLDYQKFRLDRGKKPR